ncbi:MAG: methenyltetrahydromethanopterin cyclohydrolase [Clostridiales bacterium]|nr:methenyltetrahydromethanopterin cyclohydrolase [Clostridiales bacterium]MDY4180424.1 methenyltetrahydromethanopterin cyclohydrolase [Pseudoflavonifractor sp.]
MEYSRAAREKFQEIAGDAPAFHCGVRQSPSGTVIDAGWSAPGGWMAAKRALEGLMGGRGQVSLAHRRMENGMQLPVVEVFADDPLALAQAFRPDGTGTFGVKGGEEYALGVVLGGETCPKAAGGNVIAAPKNSLFAGVTAAGSLLAVAVDALLAEGVQDIQWGWSSCPVAAMTLDQTETERRRAEMAAAEGVVSLWVRGEENAIRRAVGSVPMEKISVHELVTAFTYQKR